MQPVRLSRPAHTGRRFILFIMKLMVTVEMMMRRRRLVGWLVV